VPTPLRISVVTPCLNAGKYIEEAIVSVLNQNYESTEHIVVDGGSQDQTVEVLRRYPHLVWRSEPDQGQADAMNKGFRLATGDIIVYLNADDYFLPGAFESVCRQFEQGADFVVGKVWILHEDGSRQLNDPRTRLADMLRWWEEDAFCCNPAGYFYRREVQERIGGFNVNNHDSMDYEFLLEAARRFELTKVDRTLGVYRRFKGTKTYESIANFEHAFHFGCTDRFLGSFGEDYQAAYKKTRDRHMKSAMEDKYIATIIANLEQSRYRSAVHSMTELLLFSPLRIFYRFGKYLAKQLSRDGSRRR